MKPEVIKRHIVEVLRNITRRKGAPHDRGYMSAYQVLDRLPTEVREYLIAQHGTPGRDNTQGAYDSAAAAVSRILARMVHVDKVWVDGRGLRLQLNGVEITPGNEYGFNLYRLSAISYA